MYPKRSKEYPDGDFLKTERENEDEKYQVSPKGEVTNLKQQTGVEEYLYPVLQKDLYQFASNLYQFVEFVESEISTGSEL